MADKNTEKLVVKLDDLGLSLLGWRAECTACLLTRESYDDNLAQQVELSLTADFVPGKWRDRFPRYGNKGDNAEIPQLFATLNRRASDSVPCCLELTDECTTVREVDKFALRISKVSEEWRTETPLTSDEILVNISAFDLAIIRGSKLELPPPTVDVLPVEVIDETRTRTVSTRVTFARAEVSCRMGNSVPPHRPAFRIHMEGVFEFVSDWYAEASSASSEVIAMPNIKMEVIDNEGFLLRTMEFDFGCVIPVDAPKGPPRRQPLWVLHWEGRTENYAGEPSQVIVRFRDGRDDW